jgi:hypothetical protein
VVAFAVSICGAEPDGHLNGLVFACLYCLLVSLEWGDSGGPEQLRRFQLEMPQLPATAPTRRNLPTRLAIAFVEDLQEAQSGRRWHGEAAWAMQQPDACQIAHSALQRIAFCKVLRPAR